MIEWLTDPAFHRYLIAISFVTAGLLHFLKTRMFMQIMPDYIPWHKAMVWISGVAEVAGGIGILFPATRLSMACCFFCWRYFPPISIWRLSRIEKPV